MSSKSEKGVVAFSATLAGTTNVTVGGRARSKRIEAAMNAAVEQCYAEGITDAEVHLERKLAARATERAAIDAEDAAALRAAQEALAAPADQ